MLFGRILAVALPRTMYSFVFIQSFQCWQCAQSSSPAQLLKFPPRFRSSPCCHILSCTFVQAA